MCPYVVTRPCGILVTSRHTEAAKSRWMVLASSPSAAIDAAADTVTAGAAAEGELVDRLPVLFG